MLIEASFIDVYNMGLKGQIFGSLWAQNKSKFRSLVIFSTRFHWFYISIASHVHCKYF